MAVEAELVDAVVEVELAVEEVVVVVVEETTKEAMADEAEDGIHPLFMSPQRNTSDSHQMSD